jgi:AraC-like DNA-binding protein
MWSFFEPSRKKRLADLTEVSTTEEKVHSALLELLPSGGASLDTVAKKLGTSPRTLRRRLKTEEQNFQAILNGTREKLAMGMHY